MQYEVAGPSSIRDFNLEEHFRPSSVYHYSPSDNRILFDSNEQKVPIPQEVTPTAWISNNFAVAWNKAGDIVGDSFFYADSGVGFLYKNGEATYFEPKILRTYQLPRAINELGQVVGVGESNLWVGNAYLFANGVKTNLGGLPGAGQSTANDINNAGTIVGWSKRNYPLDPSSDYLKGFVVQDGKMFDLNTVTRGLDGWNINEGLAVTEDGWIYAAVDKWNPADRSVPFKDNFWLKPLDPSATDNTSDSQNSAATNSEPSSTGSTNPINTQSPDSGASSSSASTSTSTVIDTSSGGFWTTSTNTPSLKGPATNTGGSVLAPQPAPVPEPATCLIWGSLAIFLIWKRLA